MKAPEKMSKIINGKRYSVETATLIAGNDYWDGNNYERSGRNTFLYRTPRGNYFFVHLTKWQGEFDRIEACTTEEAIAFYDSQRDECQYEFYEEAFPGVTVEEA